jgi:hypothetical protein
VGVHCPLIRGQVEPAEDQTGWDWGIGFQGQGRVALSADDGALTVAVGGPSDDSGNGASWYALIN